MSESMSPDHERYMRLCIDIARRALASGDVPVGSLIVLNEQIIAEGVEAVKARRDVTAHAEIEALRIACKRLDTLNLTGSTLYTTVEPCAMCAYAIRLARVATVVTGTPPLNAQNVSDGWTVLTNAAVLPDRPPPAVIRNVLEQECSALLRERQQ